VTLHELRALSLRLCEQTHALVADIYRTLNDQVLPAMAGAGIRLLRHAERNAAQRAWVADYFRREVKPLLSPIGLDPAHPFPQVVNKSLNFIVELSGSDAFGRETAIAIVKAPHQLPRVLELPAEVAPANSFVLLASIIHAHLGELFAGRRVGYSQFRVTRDDLWFDEEEVKNLRQALEGELPQRQFGLAVRLEVAANCAPLLAQLLLQQFELEEADLYRCDGPVNLARLTTLVDEADRTELKYPPFVPGTPDRLRDRPDVLAAIRQHDILLHHPYQSFDPVVEFIRKASDDPDVVAIKQTVYRTGVNSILMDALVEAARRGKEVPSSSSRRGSTRANINWAEHRRKLARMYGCSARRPRCSRCCRRELDAAPLRCAAVCPLGKSSPAHGAAIHRLRLAHRESGIVR
jgi:polyphosphate kinase